MFRLATTLLLLGAALTAAGDPELAREPSWRLPPAAAVRERAVAWATAAAADRADDLAKPLAAIWDRLDAAADPVSAAVATVALIDPRVEKIRRAAAVPGGPALPPPWIGSAETADFPRQAVTLWLGRELVRQGRFDEALPLLVDLDLATAVDPAGLLFFRGCCQHWLLDRAAAIDSFDQLLERDGEIPVRYARLAAVLRADIAAVESGSLDHIARRMRDVRRRLDQGLAGPLTRRVQDGVVESLDKLIEEAEKQRQQQGQAGGGAGGGGSGQGGDLQPMDDSQLAGGRGPGEVRKRDLGGGDGWGNLPPQEREAALQQIGREFPPHYREAIEHYFKRLATGEDAAP
jgi:tetratricopeptide (TPR) repeat protein